MKDRNLIGSILIALAILAAAFIVAGAIENTGADIVHGIINAVNGL